MSDNETRADYTVHCEHAQCESTRAALDTHCGDARLVHELTPGEDHTWFLVSAVFF